MQNILYKWIVALDKLKVASHNTSVVDILFVTRDYLTHSQKYRVLLKVVQIF
jgi:hypothetical protein